MIGTVECPTEPFKCLCPHTDIFASLLFMNSELLHMGINVLYIFFYVFAVLNEVSEAYTNPYNYIQFNTWAYRIKTIPAKPNWMTENISEKMSTYTGTNLSPLPQSMHNAFSENSLAMCAVQTWDNVPEAFQGQDGFSDIREKPHRAEADSLHVLHLPPIKRPWALRLSRILSLSDCKLPPDFSPPRKSHFFNIHEVLTD